MLTCKEVTRLASEKLDRPLSLRERIEFRMHLMMCVACTRFDTQMQFMRKALSRYAHKDMPKGDESET